MGSMDLNHPGVPGIVDEASGPVPEIGEKRHEIAAETKLYKARCRGPFARASQAHHAAPNQVQR